MRVRVRWYLPAVSALLFLQSAIAPAHGQPTGAKLRDDSALTLMPAAQRLGTLLGTVRQDSSGRPLAGVEVVVEGANRQTTTDAGGRFVLENLPLGTYAVLFRLLGYRPTRLRVNLAEGDTTRADVTMVREGVQQLDPVVVTERPRAPRGVGREAFEERRARGFGKFIDSTELRRSENRRVSDMLRALPGLKIVRFRECQDPVNQRGCEPVKERAASGRGAISIVGRTEACWMSVMLDGVPLYQSGSSSPPPDLGKDVRVADLESIEVYRSAAETPTEFGGAAAACGVLLLWSRRR